ncbi:MAG TPA: hypothetical protein VHV78_14565, partial [Gemmatimonadaceae bacterium]|nr:hypothetical protein [Gemmatimonadaceae bacterium]
MSLLRRDAFAARLYRHGSARWSTAVIGLLVIAAILGPALDPYAARAQLDLVHLVNSPPSLAHPFGTDQYSRDLLARVLEGARISLAVGALSALLSITLGTSYGLVAGYAGGAVDTLMMRSLDGLLSIPRVLMLIAVLTLWSPVQLPGLIILIGATG